ncbi:uncharacterized protein LOC143145977 [Ptiloglossa arizonensis]|uniref:uncharacterized protein LOC143145977 n=1 Tax=Ptiloglossa arizonensis TaxID=3350558 RepID=UPI003FA16640
MAHSDGGTINLTMFCLKLTGISVSANRNEERHKYIARVFLIFAMIFHCWIITIDAYYNRDDFAITLYNLCSCLSAYMSVFKLLCLLGHKSDFLCLIQYLRRKFLNGKYDLYEKTVLDTCNRTSALFTYSFTCFVVATLLLYVVNPIFGKSIN